MKEFITSIYDQSDYFQVKNYVEPKEFYTAISNVDNRSIGLETSYTSKLSELFKTTNRRKIISLINNDSHLFKYLYEIYYRIIDNFNSNDISLEPDEEDVNTINIIVTTKTSPEVTLQNLNKFNEKYFINVNPDLKNKVSIGINQL